MRWRRCFSPFLTRAVVSFETSTYLLTLFLVEVLLDERRKCVCFSNDNKDLFDAFFIFRNHFFWYRHDCEKVWESKMMNIWGFFPGSNYQQPPPVWNNAYGPPPGLGYILGPLAQCWRNHYTINGPSFVQGTVVASSHQGGGFLPNSLSQGKLFVELLYWNFL